MISVHQSRGKTDQAPCLFSAFTSFILLFASCIAASAAPPNILSFFIDDMGWQETSVPFHTEPTKLNRDYPNLYDQPPYSSIRRDDWKLIYWHTTRKLELFNLNTDLGESTNLADQNPEHLRTLATLLSDHLRETKAVMPLDKATNKPVPWPDQTFANAPASLRNPIFLSGPWQVRLDESDQGITHSWYAQSIASDQTTTLPGSLAASGLGHPFDPSTGAYPGTKRPYLKWPAAGYTDTTRVDELGALVPSHFHLGPAWYERKIEIPAEWSGHPLRLTLERVKWTSRLWVNGHEIPGQSTDSLHTPHAYQFTPSSSTNVELGTSTMALRLTLRIDNRPPLNIGLAGHGYGMETEPIWNGVAGDVQLEPLGPAHIDQVRIHPHPDGTIQLHVTGQTTAGHEATIRAKWRAHGYDGAAQTIIPLKKSSPKNPAHFTITFNVDPPQPLALWDEFHPNLHHLDISLHTGDDVPADTRNLRIGIRDLRRDGRRLLLNSTPLFLRGNLDCAIHPKSDTPPTNRAWWQRVLTIHQQAGFNHIRFHTWCPPEIAFTVADELGLYLQVETAYWVDNWIHDTAPNPPRIGEDPAIDAWVLAESKRILRAYGHHPSFAFFCLGNEFGMNSDWDTIDRIVAELGKETDSILISGTCARKSGPHDDYWVTHHSGAAARGLGPAHTDWDFSPAVAATEKPVISHETGQRQSWPDYDSLLPAFTGPVRPRNLTRLQARSTAAGIADHRARCEASARFAHLLYKAEHEAMRRTPGLAGYQLLMLHDFTGQGEAHVGLLDAFFREKPGITLDSIKNWNGPTVPLARFPSYTWTSDQTFTATLHLAHQGPGTLTATDITWSLHDPIHNQPVASGKLDTVTTTPGSLTRLADISARLTKISVPTRLDLAVWSAQRQFRNTWPIWVYPPPSSSGLGPSNLDRHPHLTKDTLSALASGHTILLSYHKASGPRFRQTRWGSTFWTGAWGWGSGLGLMCEPGHPALAGFPNDGHSDWQWQQLAEGATCISLDPEHATPATIVEQLSTFHNPTREAFLVEARVGKGRLIACGFDLEHDLAHRPAARAFRVSLLNYARSRLFQPKLTLTPAQTAEIFAVSEPLDAVARADSEAPGYEAGKAIDGNPDTFWHTHWGAIEPPHPHELIIEFKQPKSRKGIRLKNRSDQGNGRPAEISIFLSNRADDWGAPVLDHASLENTADWQKLTFPETKARFLRLLTHREIAGRPFASLAELQTIPPTP